MIADGFRWTWTWTCFTRRSDSTTLEVLAFFSWNIVFNLIRIYWSVALFLYWNVVETRNFVRALISLRVMITWALKARRMRFSVCCNSTTGSKVESQRSNRLKEARRSSVSFYLTTTWPRIWPIINGPRSKICETIKMSETGVFSVLVPDNRKFLTIHVSTESGRSIVSVNTPIDGSSNWWHDL